MSCSAPGSAVTPSSPATPTVAPAGAAGAAARHRWQPVSGRQWHALGHRLVAATPNLAMRILHGTDAMVSLRTWIFLRTRRTIMTNRVTGVWRLRSAERTAHGNTSDWFGADPDGLLIFTDDLHFTEAITRTDLPLAASGDRLSTTPEENRALAQGTLGS